MRLLPHRLLETLTRRWLNFKNCAPSKVAIFLLGYLLTRDWFRVIAHEVLAPVTKTTDDYTEWLEARREERHVIAD